MPQLGGAYAMRGMKGRWIGGALRFFLFFFISARLLLLLATVVHCMCIPKKELEEEAIIRLGGEAAIHLTWSLPRGRLAHSSPS